MARLAGDRDLHLGGTPPRAHRADSDGGRSCEACGHAGETKPRTLAGRVFRLFPRNTCGTPLDDDTCTAWSDFDRCPCRADVHRD